MRRTSSLLQRKTAAPSIELDWDKAGVTPSKDKSDVWDAETTRVNKRDDQSSINKAKAELQKFYDTMKTSLKTSDGRTLGKLLATKTIKEIMQSQDLAERQLGYKLRTELQNYLIDHLDDHTVNLFLDSFGESPTSWLEKKVVAKVLASIAATAPRRHASIQDLPDDQMFNVEGFGSLTLADIKEEFATRVKLIAEQVEHNRWLIAANILQSGVLLRLANILVDLHSNTNKYVGRQGADVH